jgi:hypothetical protein
MKGQIKNGLIERTGRLGPVVRGLIERTGRSGPVVRGLTIAAVLLVAATMGFAEPSVSTNSPRLGVPGTINYVEGQASLNGQPLGTFAVGSTVVQPNQPLDTHTGYVEVLLTPGAFLRIGNNSEVVMQSLGLANIQMQVVRGSAMIEAADLVKGTVMDVNMDGSTTQIEKRGLYDFDANQPAIKVLDGKAKVQEAATTKDIGKDHEILLADNPKLKSQDFNNKLAESDPLYVWSSARSEAEAQANVNMASTLVVNGGWYGPGWYWDPFWADYAFIPGAGFLYSPFGWGFYSPGFVYAAPIYRGYYRGGYYRGGVIASGVRPSIGGFHGGFAGGFHGGGRR